MRMKAVRDSNSFPYQWSESFRELFVVMQVIEAARSKLELINNLRRKFYEVVTWSTHRAITVDIETRAWRNAM